MKTILAVLALTLSTSVLADSCNTSYNTYDYNCQQQKSQQERQRLDNLYDNNNQYYKRGDTLYGPNGTTYKPAVTPRNNYNSPCNPSSISYNPLEC